MNFNGSKEQIHNPIQLNSDIKDMNANMWDQTYFWNWQINQELCLWNATNKLWYTDQNVSSQLNLSWGLKDTSVPVIKDQVQHQSIKGLINLNNLINQNLLDGDNPEKSDIK